MEDASRAGVPQRATQLIAQRHYRIPGHKNIMPIPGTALPASATRHCMLQSTPSNHSKPGITNEIS